MAYYEATVGATATPALSMMNTLDTMLLANGWQFIETYTAATNVSNIYKSPAASNSINTDFYIAVNRTDTTGTSVALCIFEQWNTSTKRAINYAPNGAPTAGANVPGANGEVQDTTGVLPSATTANASLFKNANIAVSTTGWTYYINVNADRIIASSSIGAGVYCGIYDSFYNPSRPALCTVVQGNGQNGTSLTYGAITREPRSGAASGNWHIYEYVGSVISTTFSVLAFAPLRYQFFTTDPFTNQNLIWRKMILTVRGAGTANADILGLYKDTLISIVGATTSLPGDTLSYTLGGTTYDYVSGYKALGGNTPMTHWIPKQ